MEKTLRIALLANCTVQLFPEYLREDLKLSGIQAEIWVAGYNQVRQQILDSTSDLYRFQPQVVILYLDAEDLFREVLENPFAFTGAARSQAARDAFADLAQLLDTAAPRLPGTGFLLNTAALPPLTSVTGLDYNSGYSVSDIGQEYNQSLRGLAESRPALIVDTSAVMATIGYNRWRDARFWYLARSRWSGSAMRGLAQAYGAAVRGWLGVSRKCLVVDLDNTLWGGIIGEDGVNGIVLGEEGLGLAFVEFQLELLNLHRKGVLLAICSKNNPADALAVFRSHPSMRLKEENFSAMRVNWEDKVSNLRAIAAELNVGTDSLVFIDDNPAERGLIADCLPEVLVPDWPADPSEYKSAVLELAARHFPRFRLTEEDRRRNDIYRAQSARRSTAAAMNLDDFYRSLEMSARIGTADSFTIPRIAQLSQKTNQFNLTTRRYSEAEVAAASARDDTLVLWLDLTDRFGANGIVGVLILRQQAKASWHIDTFLLSCRVIGRTVERAFLAHVCRLLRERGASRLTAEYRPTARNGLVSALYSELGFSPLQEGEPPDGSTGWELDLEKRPLAMPEWIQVIIVEESAHA